MASLAVFTSFILIALFQISHAVPLRLQKRAAFYIANETDAENKNASTISSPNETLKISQQGIEPAPGIRWGRTSYYELDENIEAIIASIMREELARMKRMKQERGNRRISTESAAGTKTNIQPLHPEEVPEEVLKEMGIYRGTELQKKMAIFKERFDRGDSSIVPYPNGNVAPPGSVCIFGDDEYWPRQKISRQPHRSGGGYSRSSEEESRDLIPPGQERKYDMIRSFIRGQLSDIHSYREYEDKVASEISPQWRISVEADGKEKISPLTAEDQDDPKKETENEDYWIDYPDTGDIPPLPTGVGVGRVEMEPFTGTHPPEVLRELLKLQIELENKYRAAAPKPGKID